MTDYKITQEMLEELSKIFVLKEFDEDRKIWVFNNSDKYADKFIHEDEWNIDDYTYKWAAYATGDIYDKISPGTYTEDELQNEFDTIVWDLEADVYTWDLTGWLHSSNNRVYYLTEVLEETDIKDGFQLLAEAQLIEKREIYYMVFRVVMKLFEEWMEE